MSMIGAGTELTTRYWLLVSAQFCSQDVQEAVLSSMLHRDRRELHHRAANLARTEADKVIAKQQIGHSGTDYRLWELNHVIFSHLLGILKAESRALKRHVTLEDLRGILSSGKWLAEKCRSTGRLEDCMQIHVSLWRPLLYVRNQSSVGSGL